MACLRTLNTFLTGEDSGGNFYFLGYSATNQIAANMASDGCFGIATAAELSPQYGTHDGANDVAVLADSGESWTIDEHVGKTVYNLTDGSSGTITANTATTITATLSGGAENDWDTGDIYNISNPYDVEPSPVAPNVQLGLSHGTPLAGGYPASVDFEDVTPGFYGFYYIIGDTSANGVIDGIECGAVECFEIEVVPGIEDLENTTATYCETTVPTDLDLRCLLLAEGTNSDKWLERKSFNFDNGSGVFVVGEDITWGNNGVGTIEVYSGAGATGSMQIKVTCGDDDFTPPVDGDTISASGSGASADVNGAVTTLNGGMWTQSMALDSGALDAVEGYVTGITPPVAPGTYVFTYTITPSDLYSVHDIDASGCDGCTSDTATVTIQVDSNAEAGIGTSTAVCN